METIFLCAAFFFIGWQYCLIAVAISVAKAGNRVTFVGFAPAILAIVCLLLSLFVF